MNLTPIPDSNILIASDKKSNATLVKNLLKDDFANIFTTTNPDQATADFDRHRPSVLLLVFDTLEQSQSFYLGMFRNGGMVQLHPHHTIVFSSKNEVKRAYKLCREGIFDDYILFWPVNEDTPRLSMSVHLALRELAATTANTPTTADFAAQARRLATSENILTAQITQGGARIDSLEQDVTQASNLASSAFENFSQRLIQGDLREAIRADNVEELQHQLGHLKRDTIEAPLQALAKSVHPLKQWTSEFCRASAPHIESVRTLNALASTIRPLLLVVDDDPLQHKIIDSILKEENYRLLFASNSSETFNILRKKQPDLILMDVMMPDIDGVEMVRRIRIVPHLDETPILMITGKSQKDVIIKSLEAGAKDIIVKPFVRDTLLGKIKHTLMNR